MLSSGSIVDPDFFLLVCSECEIICNLGVSYNTDSDG